MAVEMDILVNNYGFSPDFAQKLLLFTKNDVESAIRIIEASEKDMMVLKFKFMSSKKMSHGAILFFYNYQTNLPEFVFSVVSSDSSLSKIKIENSWKEMYADLVRYMTANESDPETSAKIEHQLMQPENIGYIGSFLVDRNQIDLANVKRFFLSELTKVMLDTGIILKLLIEDADVFRVKNLLFMNKFGLRSPAKALNDLMMLLNIRIEPVLAPIGGIDIDKVRIGDEVLVRVFDDREVVKFVMELIPQQQFLRDGVFGKVITSQKSLDTGNTSILLEFGPGLYGRFVIAGRVRVQTKEKEQKDSPDTTVSNEPELKPLELTQAPPVQDPHKPAQDLKPLHKSKMMIVWVLAAVMIVVMLIIFWTMG